MMRYTALVSATSTRVSAHRLSSLNGWFMSSSGSRVNSSQFVTGPLASSRLLSA